MQPDASHDASTIDAGPPVKDAGRPVCDEVHVTADSMDPCVFELSTRIDSTQVCMGTVMLNAEILPCGDNDGWLLADDAHIVLGGAACQAATNASAVAVTARFPCGARLDCTCEDGLGARPVCDDLFPVGKPCATPGSHCGGPCSNSWQADYVCTDGEWQAADLVSCGVKASVAPQCRNSFGGGQLTPCCPEPELECADKPDGWPGFPCTPGQDSFCSCTCMMGAALCAC
jgi:hypothetical protein